jgi:hypothetical protein
VVTRAHRRSHRASGRDRVAQGASEWLAEPQCQSLAIEFRDVIQLPLTNRLAALGVDWREYLQWILFTDGSGRRSCDSQTVAYTSPGSRVVFVCVRHFEAMWRQNPRRATAIMIHESLHTLGLGRIPPH